MVVCRLQAEGRPTSTEQTWCAREGCKGALLAVLRVAPGVSGMVSCSTGSPAMLKRLWLSSQTHQAGAACSHVCTICQQDILCTFSRNDTLHCCMAVWYFWLAAELAGLRNAGFRSELLDERPVMRMSPGPALPAWALAGSKSSIRRIMDLLGQAPRPSQGLGCRFPTALVLCCAAVFEPPLGPQAPLPVVHHCSCRTSVCHESVSPF